MGNLCPLAIHQDILEALHRPDLLLGQEQVQSVGEHLEEDKLDMLPAVVTGRLPEGGKSEAGLPVVSGLRLGR